MLFQVFGKDLEDSGQIVITNIYADKDEAQQAITALVFEDMDKGQLGRYSYWIREIEE